MLRVVFVTVLFFANLTTRSVSADAPVALVPVAAAPVLGSTSLATPASTSTPATVPAAGTASGRPVPGEAVGEKRAGITDGERGGVAVVALPGAIDAAWPLAAAVYASSSLRARALDEVRARVLCGEAAPPGASPELRDVADTVAALRGDDAPSRALLADLARRFALRAIAVVALDNGRALARIYVPDTLGFDAAVYAPDANSTAAGSLVWSGAVRSLERTFGRTSIAALAVRPLESTERDLAARPFYASPWFWGALAAAAAGGGIAYLVTRDSGTATIHLQVQVPHR